MGSLDECDFEFCNQSLLQLQVVEFLYGGSEMGEGECGCKRLRMESGCVKVKSKLSWSFCVWGGGVSEEVHACER